MSLILELDMFFIFISFPLGFRITSRTGYAWPLITSLFAEGYVRGFPRNKRYNPFPCAFLVTTGMTV